MRQPRLRTKYNGVTWPFCAEVDLKVRVAVVDTVGDNAVVLFLVQDFDYLDRDSRARERDARNWSAALDHVELPDIAAVEVEAVGPPKGGAHADVLIVLAEWIGAGAVSILLADLWRNVRRRDASTGGPMARGLQKLTIRHAEQFARWSIAAQYFDVDTDAEQWWRERPTYGDTELTLIEERSTEGSWSFVFKTPDGTTYSIELTQPDGYAFAVVATIARRMPSDSGRPRRWPTLARFWRQTMRGTGPDW